MAYDSARTMFFTALLIYNVQAFFSLNSFVSSRRSVSGNNIRHVEVLSHQFCFLGASNMKTATCKTPHGASVLSYVESVVLLPPDSICEMNMGHNHCIQCHDGLWKRSACYTEVKRRTKRSLWFLEEEVDDCKIFCGSKAAGFEDIPPVLQSCESPKSPIFADEGKTNTIVSWSPPTALDRDGNTLNVRLLSGGGRPGDVFERGRHQFVYEAASENGLASHCYVTFEVKVQTCPVPMIPNGSRICDNTNYLYGTKCQFSCNEGYDIGGTAELLCQRTGAWSQSVPTCAHKTCPPLPTFTCSDDYNFGSVCEIHCNYRMGLSPSDPSTYCLSSGEWKQPLPSCIDTSPPNFDNCPLRNVVAYTERDGSKATVTYDDITADDNVGNVTVTKTAGPSSGSVLPVGKTSVTYKAEDAKGNVADCQFNITVIAPRCSRPPYTDHELTYTCNNDYFHSSTCSIGCSDGYSLNGTSTLTCQADSSLLPDMSWVISSSQQPSCQKPSCPALNIPKNGILTCDSNAFSQFCTPTCKPGWDIPRTIEFHSPLFSCGLSGRWLPYKRVPDCTVQRISEELRLKSKMSYFAGSCQSVDEDQTVVDNLMALINNTGFYSGTNCTNRSTCSVKDVYFTCETVNRRKRNANQDMEIVPLGRYRRSEYALVVSWDFSVLYNCGGMTVAECVTYHERVLHELRDKVKAMVDTGSINSTGPGLQIRQDSYQYDYAEFKCGEGMLPVFNTGSCAVCPTGTMYNSTSTSCVNCPKGSYQDTDHSFSCKSCPPGTTTITEGAWSDEFCQVQCQAGWVSPNGIQPCFPCAIGEYQSSIGSTTCEKCPLGTITERTGSTTLEECLSFEFSITGPSSFQSNVGVGNLSDVTLVAWVKVRYPGAGAALSFGGSDLSVRIGQNVTVGVNGQIEVTSETLRLDIWTHVCVTFKQNTQVLVLYIDGQEAATKVIIRTTIITASSTMNLTVGNREEVNLRSIQLLDRHVSAEESKTMASTCALSHKVDTVISMANMKVLSGGVNIISPSSCDAVDDCVAFPCNGHMCINTPTGYECHCQHGYTGNDCSVTPDFCINHQCQNEATCSSGVSTYTCVCTSNYKGVYCEFEIVTGGYSDWMAWSPCSLTCGGGNITRTRTCDNPIPDADGMACSGPNTETRTCNNEPCPGCMASDLQQGYSNTAPDCNSSESGLNCRATCHVGYFTSKNQISDYTCRNGVWSPSTKLPPCLKIFEPKLLEMTVQVNYTNQGCPTEGQAAKLKKLLISKLGMTQCQANSDCTSRVVVPECVVPRNMTSAFSYFKFPLPDIDLDLENYVRNKIVSPGLAKVIEAIITLEMTAAQLQNTTTKLLEVTAESTTYNPIYPVHITTNIDCPTGTFPEDGFCGECPPGTRYTNRSKKCVMCEKGSFQTKPGSFSCDRCPDGKTTHYTGSSLPTDCSVQSDSDSQRSSSPNDQTTVYIPPDNRFIADTQTNIALIVGCVLGALVLIAILLLVFVIWKRKNPLRKDELHPYEQAFHFENGDDYLTPTRQQENVYSEIWDPDKVIPANQYYHHIGNDRYLPSDVLPDGQDGQEENCTDDNLKNVSNSDSKHGDCEVQDGYSLPQTENGRASYVPMVNSVNQLKPFEDPRTESSIDPYYQ